MVSSSIWWFNSDSCWCELKQKETKVYLRSWFEFIKKINNNEIVLVYRNNFLSKSSNRISRLLIELFVFLSFLTLTVCCSIGTIIILHHKCTYISAYYSNFNWAYSFDWLKQSVFHLSKTLINYLRKGRKNAIICRRSLLIHWSIYFLQQSSNERSVKLLQTR